MLSEEQPAWWPHPEQEQDPDVTSTLSPMADQPGKQWNEQEAYELAQIDTPDLPSYDEFTTARSAVKAEAERELQSRPQGVFTAGEGSATQTQLSHATGRAMAKLGMGDWMINIGDRMRASSMPGQEAAGQHYGAMRKGYEAGMSRKAKAEAPAVPMKENRRRKVRKTRKKR